MTVLQALVLAIVQGVTELFPVSSLGHVVVLPALLRWPMANQANEQFLPFLVVMHLGTAIALVAFFWREWFDFGRAVAFNGGPRPREERRLFWRIVVATIPAVIVGGALHNLFKTAFGTPLIAAGLLVVNGFVLFTAERLRRAPTKSLDELGWADALIIGAWQCTALFPGISRSGATIVGGILRGLAHEDSARFSFLAAVPVIVAATVLEVPKLLKAHAGSHVLGVAVLAGVVAGVVAYASLWGLMRWFKRREFNALDPFAIYCWLFGALSFALLVFAPEL